MTGDVAEVNKEFCLLDSPLRVLDSPLRVLEPLQVAESLGSIAVEQRLVSLESSELLR